MSDETTPEIEVVVNPPLPEPEPEPPPEPKAAGPILLPPNLAGLVKLAATEEGRYAMQSVMLEITPEGYRAVATNGKVLGLIEGPPVGAFADYPALPGLATATNGASVGLIPSKAWTEGFRMIPKNMAKYKPILNSLVCILGRHEVSFGATDLERAPTSYNRLLEGRFPDYRQVFPRQDVVVEITVNPLLLIEVLKVAAAIAPADACKVTLSIHTPTVPMLVKTKNAQGQKFTGLVMPLS